MGDVLIFLGRKIACIWRAVNVSIVVFLIFFFSLTLGSIPGCHFSCIPVLAEDKVAGSNIKCHLIFLLFFNSHTRASSVCLSVCTKCLYLQDNSCVNIRKSY